MTDTEKMDMILCEMQGMKSEMQGMKSEMQGLKSDMQGMKSEIQDIKSEMQDMKNEMQDMKSEMQGMKKDIQEVNYKVGRLEVGQNEIKKELIFIDRRIGDVYNLALDAWGQGVENRKWLEMQKQKA